MSDPENVFESPVSDQNLPDFVQDEPPTPAPEPAPEPEPEQPVAVPLVEPETPEITPEAAPEEPAEPTAEQVRAWAGKYTSPEELEKGYRELRDLQRRTAERANAYEQATMEAQARAQQMEQALRRAMPLVQQAMAQQRGAPQEQPYGMPEGQPQQPPQGPPISPQEVQRLVDYQLQQRLAQQQAFQAAQMQQYQQYQETNQAMETFFTAHPEVERGGALDEDIASTVLALNEAWPDSDLDISSPEALEIAFEAAQRPALRQVLELNPSYVDSDAGMVLARNLASQIDGITQPSAPPTRGATGPRGNTPVVERGASQAPGNAPPLDEFEQAAAEYRQEQKRGSDVFFGG